MILAFRAVLAGCGSMARGWVKALNEPGLEGRVDFIGLVDVNLAAAEKLRAEFGLTGAATGTDLDAMLAAAKPDLLFDVAIPQSRRDVVLTGFRHGCHVLTEKPMASSLAEARQIVAATAAANKLHAVVQNRRFNSGVRRIRETIESRLLGDLTAIHADFFVGAHFGGFREEMRNVLLLDMAIHTLDAARFMAGEDPLAVYALETNPRDSWYANGAAANAIFELSDDVIFTYRGSWVAEGARTSWDSRWRIVGTTGTLLWDGEKHLEAHTVGAGEGLLRPEVPATIPAPPNESQTAGHASVIRDFLDAIEAGRQPETAGADNIKSLAMVFAAIESARTQTRVLIAA
jgi:predicted dehydrogenase